MVSIILIILAAIFYSIQWTLQFHFDKSIFSKFKNQQWWNPTLSFNNKWKNGDSKQGEKFFGSSTFLVWTTDAFHFFQMIFLTYIFLAISLNTHITPYFFLDFIILKGIFQTIFQLLFKNNL